jgi:predicted Fe-Mo cluster-binding NifX family protein
MVVCVPVAADGQVGQRWGRADRVAIAEIDRREIVRWQEIDVRWDVLHDEGTEGSHHARVARFLIDHEVEQVVAGHMGDGMRQMLGKLGLTVRVGASGDARSAVLDGLKGDRVTADR